MTRTREDKIKEAYKAYMDNGGMLQSNLWFAFKAGAEWADTYPINLWHDASEEPKFGEDVIALCDDVPVAGVFKKHLFCKGIFRYHCLLCEWYTQYIGRVLFVGHTLVIYYRKEIGNEKTD